MVADVRMYTDTRVHTYVDMSSHNTHRARPGRAGVEPLASLGPPGCREERQVEDGRPWPKDNAGGSRPLLTLRPNRPSLADRRGQTINFFILFSYFLSHIFHIFQTSRKPKPKPPSTPNDVFHTFSYIFILFHTFHTFSYVFTFAVGS